MAAAGEQLMGLGALRSHPFIYFISLSLFFFLFLLFLLSLFSFSGTTNPPATITTEQRGSPCGHFFPNIARLLDSLSILPAILYGRHATADDDVHIGRPKNPVLGMREYAGTDGGPAISR